MGCGGFNSLHNARYIPFVSTYFNRQVHNWSALHNFDVISDPSFRPIPDCELDVGRFYEKYLIS